MLDAPLLDVIWCGSSSQNDQNVLVLTDKGTIYKSSDRGVQFQRKTQDMDKIARMQIGDIDIEVKNLKNFVLYII